MQKRISLVLALLFLSLLKLSVADDYGWCNRKLTELEKQLSYAEQYNNDGRIKELERAIDNVKYKCSNREGYSHHKRPTDSALERDESYERYLTERVCRYKEKILEVEYELERAELKGDSQEIAKKNQKLKKLRAKLKVYKKELDNIHQ